MLSPTDLTHHQECAHLTRLDLGVAAGEWERPDVETPEELQFVFDRGLELLERTAQREGRLPLTFFGVDAAYPHHAKGVARVAGVAARALDHGMGRLPAAPPPSLYAYDPDTGRLAVTTPAYNTAVVPVNQDAFPYGGIELARLFDARQEVAGAVTDLRPVLDDVRYAVEYADLETAVENLVATLTEVSGGRLRDDVGERVGSALTTLGELAQPACEFPT